MSCMLSPMRVGILLIADLYALFFPLGFDFQYSKELLIVWTKFDNSASVYSVEIILDQIIEMSLTKNIRHPGPNINHPKTITKFV